MITNICMCVLIHMIVLRGAIGNSGNGNGKLK